MRTHACRFSGQLSSIVSFRLITPPPALHLLLSHCLISKYQQSLVTLCSLIWYELSKASHVAAVIGRSATCDTQMFSYLSLDSKQNNSVVIRLLIQLADRYKFFHTVIFTTCRNFHSHASCFKSWWNCFFSSIKPTEWCFLTLGPHMFLMCILMVF